MQIFFLFFFASLTASASIGFTPITPWTVYQPTYPAETEVTPTANSNNVNSVLSDETRSIFRATADYAKKIEALAKYVVEKGVHSQKVKP